MPGSSAVAKADGSGTASVPDDIRWVRQSAEYQALARQAYRQAASAIEDFAEDTSHAPGSWAVVLDADETVLDNTTFEIEVATGVSKSWPKWVKRREANAVPGAAAFTRHVRERGGVVAIVTNRSRTACSDTRANLEAVGIAFDILLCKSNTSQKEPRWQSIEDGTAEPAFGPLEIAAYVGDSITDFPDLDQTLRERDEAAYDNFGSRFFVIPNPMYGDWQSD